MLRRQEQALLTPKETAKRLRITVKHLFGFASDREIRFVDMTRGKKNSRRMFTEEDIDEFIERRKRGDVKSRLPAPIPNKGMSLAQKRRIRLSNFGRKNGSKD